VPTGVVAGERSKAKLTATVQNVGTSPFSDRVTVSVYLSSDQAIDDGDVPLPSVTRPLRLKPGAEKAMPVKITAFPDVSDGDYYVLARVSSASSGDSDPVAAATRVTIAAPFSDLVSSFVASPTGTQQAGGRGIARLSVLNQGNVVASGPVTVELLADSPDGQTRLGTFEARMKLKPGKAKLLKLRFVLPAQGGNYTLKAAVGSVDSPDANTVTGGAFTIDG
jgi:hypothetical protein